MTENEQDKPSVVVETHTVIDPNAMVIKFFITNIAHTAVFRACWLSELACLAFIILEIHNMIIIISFQSSLVVCFIDNTRITRACNKE
jgi:hypothetical protein